MSQTGGEPSVPLAYSTEAPGRLSAVVLGAVGLRLIGVFYLVQAITIGSLFFQALAVPQLRRSIGPMSLFLGQWAVPCAIGVGLLLAAERLAERLFGGLGGVSTSIDVGQAMRLVVSGIGLFLAANGLDEVVQIVLNYVNASRFEMTLRHFVDSAQPALPTVARFSAGLLLFLKPGWVVRRWAGRASV